MRRTLESYPNLVKEFHFKKNTPLLPKDLTSRSGIRIWWKCKNGHEWESKVYNRTRVKKYKFKTVIGTGCPYCSNKKASKENNLKVLFPTLAKEWHPTKNGNLKPEQVTKGYYKSVWWKCKKGHEWKVRVVSRTRIIKYKFKTVIGTGCPYCSNKKASKENNLKVLFPTLAKEWHPTKNGKVKPEDVIKGSDKKYWWKCRKGHEWQATSNSRTTVTKKNGRINYGSKCPFCSGLNVTPDKTFKVLLPNLAKEWHPTKNGNYKSDMFAKFSSKKIWWVCPKNHDYISRISQRSRGQGCPKCTRHSSKPEFRILSELETLFKEVDSRHKFKKVEIDIFIKDINVGIEYDGSFFHQNKESVDKKKNKFLNKNLIKLIRVRRKPLKKLNNYDVIVGQDELNKKDLNNIVNSIYNFCNKNEKKLIKKYLKKKSFINDQSYNKYLSYFPAPIPKNSLASFNIKYVNEWNYERNYPLKPESFFRASATKVWWKCSKAHEWVMPIKDRTRKDKEQNCPYCAGRRVNLENNLKVLFPTLAKEWHPTKNGNLKPEQVTKSSNKKVWWKCKKGHEWKTAITNRSHGRTNCPYCFNIKKKLFL